MGTHPIIDGSVVRFEDWEARLSAYFDSCLDRAFRYGAWDCGVFASGAIREITGVDLYAMREWRCSRRSDARAAMDRSVTLACAVLSEYSNATYASRGDLALVHRGRIPAWGIVSLDGLAVMALARRGLCRLPLSCISRAWKV